MLSKIFLCITSAVFLSSLVTTSNAGSATNDICIKQNVGTQGIIKMASLSEKRSYRISGERKSEIAQTPRPVPGTIKVAGRCGSSKYYCSSPGFLYCCGNSSSGFYCAADVNGCTR